MHVCNDRSSFITYVPTDSSLKNRDSTTKVKGLGTVERRGMDPTTGKEKAITLSNARYSPGFHTNLVSYGALRGRVVVGTKKVNIVRDDYTRPPPAVGE